MNTPLATNNDLLDAYIYASQQLLIANEFEKRLPQAFARIGKGLNASRINVYRQQYLDGDRIKVWHKYSWRSDDTFLFHLEEKQGIVHHQDRINRWNDSITENGYVRGTVDDFPIDEQPFFKEYHIQSILIVPIYIDEIRWGIIGFDDCEQKRVWSTIEINILKGLAGIIGTAVANDRLYQAEQKARQRAELIRDLSRAIGQNLDRTEIVQRTLQKLKYIVTYDTASIYITAQDAESEFIAISGFADEDAVAREAVKLLKNSPILHRMSRTLQSVISGDVYNLDEWIWVPGAESIRSFIAAPMVYQQKMVGALMLDSKHVDFFHKRDLHVIETLAQHIAISLENSYLLKRAQQEAAEKTAILQASMTVSSTRSFHDTLSELAKQLGEGIDATSVFIVQLQPETETAVTIAEYIAPHLPSNFADKPYQPCSRPHQFTGGEAWLKEGTPYICYSNDPDLNKEERQNLLKYAGKSTLSLPLIVKGQLFGYAQLWQCTHDRPFTKQQISLCVGIAQQAAIAFENSTLFAEQERQLHLSKTLQQVGSLLTARLPLEELYENIFDLLSQVVEYHTVSLQLIDNDHDNAYYEIGRGFEDDIVAKKFVNSISKHSVNRVIKHPHWAIINDTFENPDWVMPESVLRSTRSWIGAALIVKGRIIGILNVDHHRPHAYTPAMGETVAAFANQAAIAVENKRLYHEIEQHINELTILHRAAESTAAIIDQDELLYITTDMIVQHMPLYQTFGVIFPSTDEPDFLIPHASAHGVSAEISKIHIPIAASVTGKVMQTGNPMLVANRENEPLSYNVAEGATGSEIAVPLKIQDEVIGLIYTAHPSVNMFDDDDVRFLTTLAGQLSAAIERAKLYEGLRRQTELLAQQVAHRTAELQRERDRMQAVLENAGEGIVLTDMNNRIAYINPAMEQLGGYTKAEVLGHTPGIWRSSKTAVSTYKEIWSTLSDGRTWRGELINMNKNGKEYDALVTISPLTEEGKTVGYVSMQADIGRLKEVDRLKSKFVSNVSHELRTPLANIKTYLTLLERGKPEKKKRYMDVIHQEIDRLARLLQDLLDLSRLEAASAVVHAPPINLAAVMKQHFSIFSAKAREKEIEYEIDIPYTPMLVTITKAHAGQLFTNLIGNALLYTPRNGRVSLHISEKIKEDRPYIHITIRDNGDGISPDDLPHLFERFYRGKGFHNSNVPGTGLGLAICNEIVKRYNGSIGIESEVGKGTTVTLCLPLAK